MMRCVRWVGDWAWVFAVFVLGKVLRLNDYRPIVVEYSDGVSFIRFPFFLRVGRMDKLAGLWGYRIESFKDPYELRKLAFLLFLQADQSDVQKVEMQIPFRGKIDDDSKDIRPAPAKVVSASS